MRHVPATPSYWSLEQAAARNAADPYRGSAADAVNELEAHLKRAISLQRIATCRWGVSVGGVDSSTIVALMQADTSRAVKTYTIGYRESEYSEAEYARAVAKHLGTDHTELYVTAREALQVVRGCRSSTTSPSATVRPYRRCSYPNSRAGT